MTHKRNTNSSFRLLASGDFSPDTLPGSPGSDRLLRQGPEALFGSFCKYLGRADLAVLNLEAPLLSRGKPILKCGPAIRAQPRLARTLRPAGFHAVNLANNHINDFGPAGVRATIDRLRQADLPVFGAGPTHPDARAPLSWTHGSRRIALLGIAEDEFSIAGENAWGAASCDPLEILPAISQAARDHDLVLVFVHGGCEYNPLPSPRTVQRYRAYARAGASAVIASHPHVPQGWEFCGHTPILYSLGNFLFPWPGRAADSAWYHGLAVELTWSRSPRPRLNVLPLKSSAEPPAVQVLAGPDRQAMLDYLEQIRTPLAEPRELQALWEAWCLLKRPSWEARWKQPLRLACRSANARQALACQENTLRCQAHREVGLTLLELARQGRLPRARKHLPRLRRLMQLP